METIKVDGPISHCPCCGQPVDIEPDVVRADDVIRAVASVLALPISEIFGQTRERQAVRARQMIALVLSRYGYTQRIIAQRLRLDRSTVSTSIRAMEDMVDLYPDERAKLFAVIEQLQR